jgi:hypothetical protein
MGSTEEWLLLVLWFQYVMSPTGSCMQCLVSTGGSILGGCRNFGKQSLTIERGFLGHAFKGDI